MSHTEWVTYTASDHTPFNNIGPMLNANGMDQACEYACSSHSDVKHIVYRIDSSDGLIIQNPRYLRQSGYSITIDAYYSSNHYCKHIWLQNDDNRTNIEPSKPLYLSATPRGFDINRDGKSDIRIHASHVNGMTIDGNQGANHIDLSRWAIPPTKRNVRKRLTMATVMGGAHNDVLVGTRYRDKMFGEKGNDTLRGLAGNDYIEGNAGRDRIYGGRGDDELYGAAWLEDTVGDGADRIWGGAGADTIWGGAGNDVLYGGTGNDDVCTSDCGVYHKKYMGNKTVYAGSGNDVVMGGADFSRIYLGSGNDTYWSNPSTAWVWGGSGNDTFDFLKHKRGPRDRVYGGPGNDLLYNVVIPKIKKSIERIQA